MGVLLAILGLGALMGFAIIGSYLLLIIKFILYNITGNKKFESIFLSPMNYIKNDIIKKENGEVNFLGIFLLMISLIGILAAVLPYTPLGVEQIGHIIEKNNYETVYRGVLTSHDSDKEYEVDIDVSVENGVVVPKKIKIINRLYSFEVWTTNDINYEIDGFNVIFESVVVTDRLGNEFYLKLTRKK
jgi:uncharacterized alkaline shock family protein YloU